MMPLLTVPARPPTKAPEPDTLPVMWTLLRVPPRVAAIPPTFIWPVMRAFDRVRSRTLPLTVRNSPTSLSDPRLMVSLSMLWPRPAKLVLAPSSGLKPAPPFQPAVALASMSLPRA